MNESDIRHARASAISLDRDGEIGRDAGVEFRIEHPSISRHHCQVRIRDGIVRIRDLGSRNGTIINGRRIEESILREGDVLQLGSCRFAAEAGEKGLALVQQQSAPAPGATSSEALPTEAHDETAPLSVLGQFKQAIRSLRLRLGCQSLFVFEFSPAGRVMLGESTEGDFVMSGTVLSLVARRAQAIWAPRDVVDTGGSLVGLAGTTIYCAPIYTKEPETIAVYAYWAGGCRTIEAAERSVRDAGELLGMWAWDRSHQSVIRDLPPVASEPAQIPLVGTSPVFLRLVEHLQRIAQTDHPVVLIGPPGSGKTTIAQIIHERSGRRERTFRRLHLAKIPPTLVESELLGTKRGAFSGAQDREGLLLATDGGTLFLDSLESCPLEVQAKLLDVLEGRSFRVLGSNREQSVDLRWIAATNEDPQELMKQGRLRRDLWDRLAALVVRIPPLASRRSDIPALAMHFLELELQQDSAFPSVRGFSPEAVQTMQGYSWPGNVRELANVVSRLLTISRTEIISADDVKLVLQEAQTGGSVQEHDSLFDLPYQEACRAFEKMYIQRKLEETGQNVSQAAVKSKLSRRALYQILKRSKTP